VYGVAPGAFFMQKWSQGSLFEYLFVEQSKRRPNKLTGMK